MQAKTASALPRLAAGPLRAEDDQQEVPWTSSGPRIAWMLLVGLTAAVIWSYWQVLVETAVFWTQPQYSHGWIVPLIGLYLIWNRRPNQQGAEGLEHVLKGVMGAGAALVAAAFALDISSLYGVGLAVVCLGVLALALYRQPWVRPTQAELWGGVAIIVAAMLVRSYAAYFDRSMWLRYSFLVTLGGLMLSLGGVRLVKWAGPAIGFLVFMFPLPGFFEGNLLMSLQRFAAVASEAVFVIMGLDIVRDGSVLQLHGAKMEVAAACSGLSMSTIFMAMAIAMVLLMQRPWWDKLIVLLSAIPIALAVNVIRIVITGLLFMQFPDHEPLQKVMHDWAGLIVMMPLALGLLSLELKLLSSLTVEEGGLDGGGPTVIGRGGALPIR